MISSNQDVLFGTADVEGLRISFEKECKVAATPGLESEDKYQNTSARKRVIHLSRLPKSQKYVKFNVFLLPNIKTLHPL